MVQEKEALEEAEFFDEGSGVGYSLADNRPLGRLGVKIIEAQDLPVISANPADQNHYVGVTVSPQSACPAIAHTDSDLAQLVSEQSSQIQCMISFCSACTGIGVLS